MIESATSDGKHGYPDANYSKSLPDRLRAVTA